MKHRLLWCLGFLAALAALIIKYNGKHMAAPGTAKLAGEYADAAVIEYRGRFPR